MYLEIPNDPASRARVLRAVNEVFVKRGESPLTPEEVEHILTAKGVEISEAKAGFRMKFVYGEGEK